MGKTADNLAAAIDGETYEVEGMYQAFIEVTKLQKEKAAAWSSTWALEAEKVYADMYSAARRRWTLETMLAWDTSTSAPCAAGPGRANRRMSARYARSRRRRSSSSRRFHSLALWGWRLVT